MRVNLSFFNAEKQRTQIYAESFYRVCILKKLKIKTFSLKNEEKYLCVFSAISPFSAVRSS